jgi:hypothetical protein
MRWLAPGFAISVCFLGVALAQEAPLVFTPSWEAQPSPAEIVSHYPRQALAQNVSGVAVLCCTPRADRSLDCHVGSEWPEGQGFGAASVAASHGYRLTQTSLEDFQNHSDTQIRLSMMWAATVVSEETRNRLVSIDRETGFVCQDLAVTAPRT